MIKDDILGLLVFLLINYIPIESPFITKYYRYKAYVYLKKKVGDIVPPNWIFPIIWYIIYTLIAISIWNYWKFNSTNNGLYISIFSLYGINIIVNKIWTSIFFRLKNYELAMYLSFFIAGTSITILTLLGIERQWLSFGLFVIYPIWSCYATFLSFRFFEEYNKYKYKNIQ